jgi:hypothetical protein
MSDRPDSVKVQQTEVTAVKEFQVTNSTVTFGNITQIGQQTVVQQKPEFFELIKPPESISPKITPQLIEVIYQQRLLVLGGSIEIDKDELARNLAWELVKELKNKISVGSCNIPIKEWQRSSEPQSIDVELQKTEQTTVFVLTQVSPQNVGYDLSRIQKAAASGQHYVVISTDTPLAKWPESARAFWQELSIQDVYSLEDLVNVLVQDLNNAGKSSLLADDLILQTVAEQLKTPKKIARFVQLLNLEKGAGEEKRPLRKETVLELIKLAQKNKDTLQQWFKTSLNPREQLLALGLSFFDGLFEDQFFAAVEKVVEGVWQKRDASLRALDYCDLDNLGNYFEYFKLKAYGSKLNGFKFVKTKDYATEIEISRIDIRRNEERRLLFEVTWESHRRQILTALPVIVQLVKDSVTKEPSNWELYGGEIRCNQLRNVLSETLSALGVVSTSATSAVQGALIKLATDREFKVQDVAASAIARWRDSDYDRDKELFGTLQRLYSIATEKKDNAEDIEEPQHYIGATVALTVSYAALYDPPNHLSEELCDWLKELSESQSSIVRAYFGYHTLFYVVPLHLTQLRYTLKEITEKHTDLNEAIAKSLAYAYRTNPGEVLNILDSWYKECIPNRPWRVNGAKITKSDRLLATVALTCGEIQCDERVGALTANKVFNQLSKILTAEGHWLVREAVITATCNQTRRHFEQIERELQTLVANVTDSECKKIVETLTEVYLEQRASLKGGDGFIEDKKQRRYRIWIDDTKRPKTAVEKTMFLWVQDDTKPAAQQVAIRASVDFARVLEQEEENESKKLEQERSGRTQQEMSAVVFDDFITIGKTQSSFYLARLVSWLATRNAQDYQPLIRNILPEAFNQHKSRRDKMSLVLKKWRRATDNKIRTISDLLKNGLWLAENLWWLALGGGIILTFTGMTLVNIIQSIPVPTSQSTPDSSVVPTPEPTSNSTFNQQEAVNVINNYLQAKERIFAPPYDRQLVANLTTGKYYEDITKPGGAIDKVQQKNEYYRYDSQQTEPLGYFSATENQAEIDVKITEQMFLHKIDGSQEDKSYSLSYRFTLAKQNNIWKIADRVKIGSQDGE